MLIYDIAVISFQKKEIFTLIIQHRLLTVMNPVSIHDNIALLSLTENLLKEIELRAWDGKLPAFVGGGSSLPILNLGSVENAVSETVFFIASILFYYRTP